MVGIRELQKQKGKILEKAHREMAAIDREINKIRKVRGNKLKVPNWSGPREPGRDYIPTTPYGDW